MRVLRVIAVTAAVAAAGAAGAPARAGYLTGLDFGERCFRAGAGVGASIIPGVPSGGGAAEHGCVSDSAIRQTGVLTSTADGAAAGVPVGAYAVAGGAAGTTTARAGVGRIAWTGGTVTHTFYLANSQAAGPATVCAVIRDFDGVRLASHCLPLANGPVTVSAALSPGQYHEASVELRAEFTSKAVNKAVVTVTRYTSLLP